MAGFKRKWYLFFVVSEYLTNTLLAVWDVFLSLFPSAKIAVTLSTLALYMALVLGLRPFDAGLDAFMELGVAGCGIYSYGLYTFGLYSYDLCSDGHNSMRSWS